MNEVFSNLDFAFEIFDLRVKFLDLLKRKH